MNTDSSFLIVGKGLAGSVLAQKLYFDYGIRNMTIVDNQQYQASLLSSGIMNPVTGRRIVKTWQCDTLFPEAENFYKEAGKTFETKFIEQKQIIRFFESIKEYNDFTIKTGEKAYQQYISEEKQPIEANLINNDFGAGNIKGAFLVNVKAFLDASNTFFRNEGILINEELRLNNLQFEIDKVIWQNKFYDHLIFCEGYHALENPFVNKLPFRPAKGEVYIANIPDLPQERLIKKGIFFLPLGDHLFWVGSTYINNDLSPEPSEKGIQILNEKVKKAIGNLSFTIERTETAIRPATKDRRPFVGAIDHPYKVYIFNGFGTKGVSLSPWCATQLCEHIFNDQPIPAEIDVNRFL